MHKINFLSFFVLSLIFLVPQATPKDLNLTIVYDNNSYNEELETRWGFSCLIEGPEKTIMFDVGG
ncbi:MAG: MBL fold metallo-hydrolase, partial [candidate division Zixibacteria bacterium]|nr:MBL fold metallo-hydrolase [candidate division Zixibacteria bacterium]